MARLRLDQLHSSLKKPLAPIYLVTGDETLLVQEACDDIRKAAQKQGFSERELHHTDAGFQWDNLINSANSLSLFSEKKIIEIRVHNGKPGDAGSKALVEYCETLNEDNLLLLVFPKIDKRSQNSKWFKAVEKSGAVVSVWPVSLQQLPAWIEKRMQGHGLSADKEAIDILAAKVEGNLLAASQEIEKLVLFSDQKHIDPQTMADAVTDSARYDVFSLVDKALAGDSAGAITTLQGLRGEGTEPTLILWSISRELRNLTLIKESMENGKSFDFCAKQLGVWSNRLALMKHCAYRVQLKQLHLLVRKSSQADKMIKGIIRGDIWSSLTDIILSLSGTEPLNKKTLRLQLQISR